MTEIPTEHLQLQKIRASLEKLEKAIPYHDRNPTSADLSFVVAAGSHGWTERARYTVPANRKAIAAYFFVEIDVAVASGETWLGLDLSRDGGATFEPWNVMKKIPGDPAFLTQTGTLAILLFTNNIVRFLTYSSDSNLHTLAGTDFITEFDA